MTITYLRMRTMAVERLLMDIDIYIYIYSIWVFQTSKAAWTMIDRRLLILKGVRVDRSSPGCHVLIVWSRTYIETDTHPPFDTRPPLIFFCSGLHIRKYYLH